MDTVYEGTEYNKSSLKHFGVLGMKWGVRKKQLAVKKAARYKARANRLKKKAELARLKAEAKQKKAEAVLKLAQINKDIKSTKTASKQVDVDTKIKNKNDKLALKERKQSLKERKQSLKKSNSAGDNTNKKESSLAKAFTATNVYANRGGLSDEQLTQALKRLQTEKAIRSLAAEEREANKNPILKYVGGKLSKALDRGVDSLINYGMDKVTGGITGQINAKLFKENEYKNKKTKSSPKATESSSKAADSSYVYNNWSDFANNFASSVNFSGGSNSSSQPNVRHRVNVSGGSDSSRSRYVNTVVENVRSVPVSSIMNKPRLGSGTKQFRLKSGK